MGNMVVKSVTQAKNRRIFNLDIRFNQNEIVWRMFWDAENTSNGEDIQSQSNPIRKSLLEI